MSDLLRIEQWAENLREVTVGRWLKAEGDAVAVGEAVCEIITEKVTFEYESPLEGVLLRIYAPEKSVVPVGYVFACVGDAGEEPPEGVEEENAERLEAHQAQARLELDFDLAGVTGSTAGAGARVKATPAARRAARDAGLALADVAAWLAADRPVTETDVADYLEAQGS